MAPEHQDALPELGDQESLHQHDRGRDKPQPNALHEDKDHGRYGLAAEKNRRDEGVADEAAQRLHLVLDHGRHFRLLDLAQMGDGDVALSYLHRALDEGWRDVDRLRQDEALAGLHGLPGWKALLARL